MSINHNKRPKPDKNNTSLSCLHLSDSEKQEILYLIPDLKIKDNHHFRDHLFNIINQELESEYISPTTKKNLNNDKVKIELSKIRRSLESAKTKISKLSEFKHASDRFYILCSIAKNEATGTDPPRSYNVYKENLDELISGVDLYKDKINSSQGHPETFRYCFLIIAIAKVFRLELFPYPFHTSSPSGFFELIAYLTDHKDPRRLIQNALKNQSSLLKEY